MAPVWRLRTCRDNEHCAPFDATPPEADCHAADENAWEAAHALKEEDAAEGQSPSGGAATLLQLRRQAEWYFSDANLSMDTFFHGKLSEALPGGWVSCSLLLCRRRMKELQATPGLLLLSLRSSHLETKVTLLPSGDVQEEAPADAAGLPGGDLRRCFFIRRRQPLPPLLANGREPTAVVDSHQTMNRLFDQLRVWEHLALSEVGDSTTVFRERLPLCSRSSGAVIAVGYERVLYGDGGPFLEVSAEQVHWDAWPHYFDKSWYHAYFDEYYTWASHQAWRARWDRWDPNPTKGLLLLYAQVRTVADRPWAPGSGPLPHAGRASGYADYRPGYFYFAADRKLITAEARALLRGGENPRGARILADYGSCHSYSHDRNSSQESSG